MNPRIPKVASDIAKLKRKITASQARLRELERQKLELENADIVAAVRSIDVPPEELAALIARLQLTPQEPKAIGMAEGVPVVQSPTIPKYEEEEQLFEEEN